MFRIVESRSFLLNIEVMASQEALILLECNKQKKGDMKLFILHPSISLQCLLSSEVVVQCDAKKTPANGLLLTRGLTFQCHTCAAKMFLQA